MQLSEGNNLRGVTNLTSPLYSILTEPDEEHISEVGKIEAPATQGRSQMGAGASRLRAAGGDSTCAGRFTASQMGRVAEKSN